MLADRSDSKVNIIEMNETINDTYNTESAYIWLVT